MYRSTEILRHAPRGAFEPLSIRRKKIDVDFTVTHKEREQYEWYVCTAFSMSDSSPAPCYIPAEFGNGQCGNTLSLEIK